MPPESMGTFDRLSFWEKYGERGMSSDYMAKVFKSGNSQFIDDREVHHPHDGDDFSRCYMLIKMAPGLKQYMHLLGKKSDVWEKLVINWDALTEAFDKKDWKTFGELMVKCQAR